MKISVKRYQQYLDSELSDDCVGFKRMCILIACLSSGFESHVTIFNVESGFSWKIDLVLTFEI